MRNFTIRPRLFLGRYRVSKIESTRSFHASTPKGVVLDSIIPLTYGIFQEVHSFTGLPWGLTIPLVCLLAKTLISLPLQIVSSKTVQKQRDISPLLHTWQNKHRYDVLREEAKTGRRMGEKAANAQILLQVKENRNKIYKKHRIYPVLQYLPVLQLPIWLCFMDTLRCMCGYESRFLAPAEAFVKNEPGFGTGGILWFQDLLVFDDYLSISTGMAMLYIINGPESIKKWKDRIEGNTTNTKELTYGRRVLKNSLMLYAMMIPVVAYVANIPGALMLYWFSGTLFTIIQRPLIDKMIGMKPAPQPAERKEVVMKTKRSESE